MDRGDGFVVVARAVEFGHAHAAQAERRDHQFAAAQAAMRHGGNGFGFDAVT